MAKKFEATSEQKYVRTVLPWAICFALFVLYVATRNHDQRQRELGPFSLLSIPAAWLAPVLGVLVCTLQLTFWENATSANSLQPPLGAGCEMLDLLLFAYIIRGLLEFRLDQRESWL